ncbi:MAG: DUF1318 domain-containing protein [Candidatus Omnitrophica bacterium]|nr:DUF1318 domain-containing protein [Candidatus Omnitrophota bacterium]
MKKFLMAVLMMVVLGAGTLAYAAYDIKTMTPQVKAALEGRKERFSSLKQLKAQGIAGENNRGYVEALGGSAADKALVNAENADRRAIYQTIVEQNELGSGTLATVEAVFAGVQRDKADAGEKIQSVAGQWMSK